MSRSTCQPPAIAKGPQEPVPEKREHVLAKIRQSLTKASPKGIRQDYSNGEFTSSSLIVGETFEAVADRRLDLEVAGDVAHFDPALKLWWRRGGSFD